MTAGMLAAEGGVVEAAPLRVEVLGPLRLVVQGSVVDVPGPKRRALLALLALAEGRAVPVDQLVDALWPGEVPESGRQALHSHVSRLRGHLGPTTTRLETLDGGYRLALDDLDGAELDLARARALLIRGRAHAGQDPSAATALLREAHRLWRGPVLADLREIAPVAAAVVELGQLHRDIIDTLVECSVAASRLDPRQLDGIVSIAATELASDPLREPAALALMRALAAAGQAPDALRTGREYRHRLAEEVGIDPSAALGELERDIARGASGPAAPPSDRQSAPVRPGRPATRLIGREGQVAALQRALTSERLVTLVGPGGVGKTRVALEVAAERSATAVLLLAPVGDAGSIPNALAAALALRVVRGDVLSACLEVLRGEPTLLVVDNCEHLLDATRDTIALLLDACPELTVLATSREPLGLGVERVSRLAPLPVPPEGVDGVERVPSVVVFLDRASRVRPEFSPDPQDVQVVAEIVRRLDGMPLAIELAAGRLSAFSLRDLHQRLDRSLDLLGGSGAAADGRHRTLRATIDWSYELLTSEEQTLFRSLSAFPDGVDLDTAEHVAFDLGLTGDPGSLLARLVDASMIDATHGERTRYRMLETLRSFGVDRLRAEGEDGAAGARLLRWAVELTGWIETVIITEQEPEADATLRRELGNLRSAWQIARRVGALGDAAAIVVALHEAAAWRDLTEIWGWSHELVTDPDLAADPRAVQVLGVAAEVAYLRGDYPLAERLAREGLTRAADVTGSWPCLTALAATDLFRGRFADALEHSLAAAASVTRPTIDLGVAALAAAYAGDLDRALTLNERMSAVAASPTQRGWAAYVAGEIDNAAGRSDRAEEHYARAIHLAQQAGTTFVVGVASVGRVTALASAGRVDDALRGYRDVVDYWAATGNWTHLWVTLRNLAGLLRRLGDEDPAALIDSAADRAPDAPTMIGRVDEPGTPRPSAPAPGRAQVLDVARRAIGRHFARS